MTKECVVPGCKGVGCHLIPKNAHQRSLWLQAMKLEENDIRIKYPLVCSLHFKDTDYISKLVKNQCLKRHAVPSIFTWHQNQACQPEPVEHILLTSAESRSTTDAESDKENVDPKDPLTGSKSSGNCTSEIPSSSSSDVDTGTKNENELRFVPSGMKTTYSKLIKPTQYVLELPYIMTDTTDDIHQDPLGIQESVENIEKVNQFDEHDIEVAHYTEIGNDMDGCVMGVEEESFEIKQEESIAEDLSIFPNITKTCQTCGHDSIPSYSVHSIKKKPNAIHFYSGLETFDKLMFVFHSLGKSDNLTYIYGKPPDHLDPLEQFFITLRILRRHREFEDIAMTYETSVKQVTNIFITWIRFMALQWRTIDLWMDRDDVRYYMPLDFHDKYPNTRVIVDATECPIKKPRLPTTQQITFSNYKNRNTIKMLVGMAPSGMITYLSPCYGGSASDRQIIERSSLLDRCDFNDEVMVDKGLNVQDIFISRGVKINMPTFFKKGNQIDPATLTKDRKIASKRVHVERIIGMLKTYKILTQAMNHTETTRK